MASVRKRDDKWIVDYKDNRGVRRLKTFTHKKSADQFRNNVVQEVERGEHVADRETKTFGHAAEHWIKRLHSRSIMDDRMSPETMMTYEVALARCLPIFKNMRLNQMTIKDVQSYVEEIAPTLSSSSVRLTFRTIFMILQHACEEKWLGANPIRRDKMRLPALPRSIVIPAKEELRAVLQAACTREPGEVETVLRKRVLIVALGIFGGLRRGEMCGLQWGDVDLDRGVIRIERSISPLQRVKSPKTDAGRREVPISRPIVEALSGVRALLRSEPKSTDRVVLSRTGRIMHPTQITTHVWYPILRKAGLFDRAGGGKPAFRLHSLRHAAASLLIEQGLSALHIKTMIGHSKVSTTLDVYGHLFPSDASIRVAAESVASRLGATETRPALLSN